MIKKIIIVWACGVVFTAHGLLRQPADGAARYLFERQVHGAIARVKATEARLSLRQRQTCAAAYINALIERSTTDADAEHARKVGVMLWHWLRRGQM